MSDLRREFASYVERRRSGFDDKLFEDWDAFGDGVVCRITANGKRTVLIALRQNGQIEGTSLSRGCPLERQFTCQSDAIKWANEIAAQHGGWV